MCEKKHFRVDHQNEDMLKGSDTWSNKFSLYVLNNLLKVKQKSFFS